MGLAKLLSPVDGEAGITQLCIQRSEEWLHEGKL